MNITNIDFTNFNPHLTFCVKGKSLEANPHSHSHMELCYVLSGKVIFNIENNIYTVEEGDIIIINPDEIHYESPLSIDKLNLLFFVGITNFQFKNNKEDTLFKNEMPIIKTSLPSRKKFTDLIDNIYLENQQQQTGKAFMLQAYLTQFLLLIIREKQKELPYEELSKSKSIAKELKNYFYNHYNEKISLEKIAKKLYISPFYISKVFKEEFGQTPINFLIKIRLEKAKILLSTKKELSIKEVAYLVGYEDEFYFSKSFKKFYGISPTEFKNTSYKT